MLVSDSAEKIKSKLVSDLKYYIKQLHTYKFDEYKRELSHINFILHYLLSDSERINKILNVLTKYTRQTREKNIYKYIKHEKVCLEFFKGLEII